MAEAILQEKDPKQQKALAKKVRNFDEAEWSKVSFGVVKSASLEKVILRYIFNILLLFVNYFVFLQCVSIACYTVTKQSRPQMAFKHVKC